MSFKLFGNKHKRERLSVPASDYGDNIDKSMEELEKTTDEILRHMTETQNKIMASMKKVQETFCFNCGNMIPPGVTITDNEYNHYCCEECHKMATGPRFVPMNKEQYGLFKALLKEKSIPAELLIETGFEEKDFEELTAAKQEHIPDKPGVYKLKNDGDWEEMEGYNEDV